METKSELLKNCKTIIAFGCSNTFGYGLIDNYSKPSEHAWPNILGKHLGLQVKNLSEGGIRNAIKKNIKTKGWIVSRKLI